MGHDDACHWAGKRGTVPDRRNEHWKRARDSREQTASLRQRLWSTASTLRRNVTAVFEVSDDR